MKIKPISPEEIDDKREELFPPEVIKIFNDAIITAWDGSSSIVYQYGIVSKIAKELNIPNGEVFSRHLLNIEMLYMKKGWKVVYDRPGFNEHYEPTFTFTKAK